MRLDSATTPILRNCLLGSQQRHRRDLDSHSWSVCYSKTWLLDLPDLVLLDFDRPGLSTLLCLLASISRSSRCEDWCRLSVRSLAGLLHQQSCLGVRSYPRRLDVYNTIGSKVGRVVNLLKSSVRLLLTNFVHRYTMVIGALVSCAFFFAYTAVRTHAQNLAFTCIIYFTVNVYYGTLYAYTPEVLPSAHRATGNGIAIACNRVMGLVSAAVATSANTATSAPIYICAVLYIVMVSQIRLCDKPEIFADIVNRLLWRQSCHSNRSASPLCR